MLFAALVVGPRLSGWGRGPISNKMRANNAAPVLSRRHLVLMAKGYRQHLAWPSQDVVSGRSLQNDTPYVKVSNYSRGGARSSRCRSP